MSSEVFPQTKSEAIKVMCFWWHHKNIAEMSIHLESNYHVRFDQAPNLPINPNVLILFSHQDYGFPDISHQRSDGLIE
jgi:hypothetical protein